jgi:deoxyadenosine/deoxycytidine kinase
LGGKTTLATKIAEDFNAKRFGTFADNPLPKFYEDQNRYAFAQKCHFLLTDTSSYQMI